MQVTELDAKYRVSEQAASAVKVRSVCGILSAL